MKTLNNNSEHDDINILLQDPHLAHRRVLPTLWSVDSHCCSEIREVVEQMDRYYATVC